MTLLIAFILCFETGKMRRHTGKPEGPSSWFYDAGRRKLSSAVPENRLYLDSVRDVKRRKADPRENRCPSRDETTPRGGGESLNQSPLLEVCSGAAPVEVAACFHVVGSHSPGRNGLEDPGI